MTRVDIPQQLYRAMKRPATKGQLRTRTWQTLVPPVDEADPVWFKRCGDYWARQEKLFGLAMSPFRMIISAVDGVVYVSTYAVVLDILPGLRTTDWSKVQVPRSDAWEGRWT